MDGATTGQDGIGLHVSFPVDEFAMIVGNSHAEVSVHVYRTPTNADGSHRFLYEHVRCAREHVFATGGSVMIRSPEGERIFHLGPDLGPLQIDISGDRPYHDPISMMGFVENRLDDLRRDTARKGLRMLVLRESTSDEVLVSPGALSVHYEGLFRLGHGWLVRWAEVSDVTSPKAPGQAGDIRIYATDGRCVVVRLDLS